MNAFLESPLVVKTNAEIHLTHFTQTCPLAFLFFLMIQTDTNGPITVNRDKHKPVNPEISDVLQRCRINETNSINKSTDT